MKFARLAAWAALTLMAAQAKALADLDAFGGSSSVGMGDVNTVLSNYAGANGGSATKISGGFYVGAEGGIKVLPYLEIGPRVEYLQAGEGEVSAGGSTTRIDSSLMSYQLGISSEVPLFLSGLSLKGGVWGGLGMASTTLVGAGNPQPVYGAGGGFVGNAGLQLRYNLVSDLIIGLDLGYRFATINDVVTTTTTVANGSVKSPFLTNADGSRTAFDFSGMNIGGALGWNF
jgi:hypothetical protein